MKKILLVFMLIAGIAYANAQQPKAEYDPELAKELGADDYGMKTYMLVILKTGSQVIEDKTVRDSLFAGHMKNIYRLADEGKLIVAGPLFANENNYRGIFILDTDSIELANEWVQSDPVIREKVLDADIYKWYGAAALPSYLEVQEKVTKTSF
ncbi:MAG: hypothetical protein IH597_11105 [Bacteroidales bacterium]|nr:hypothetical protein [Bacteroidales bacterium]